MVLENLEPKVVWDIFENILTKTPRSSKKEGQIHAKIVEWVKENVQSKNPNVEIFEDPIGNILIKAPAKPGCEDFPVVLMQAHMDMVCVTDRQEGFDFDTQPIPVRIQDNNEWVDADGTSLGADNGIGVAFNLALLVDPDIDIKHGPIEILLTVDEETGLSGAFALELKTMPITANLMVNVDSESLDYITVGSAGGGDSSFKKSCIPQKLLPGEFIFFNLKISGLAGGHSGGDIHLPRGSANDLTARISSHIESKMDLYLADWQGGSKHNAITRAASMSFAVPKSKHEEVIEILNAETTELKAYYQNPVEGATQFEPNLIIEWAEIEPETVFPLRDSQQIIQSASLIPHGYKNFSPDVPGLVETSNNFAITKIEKSEESISMTLVTSTRSHVESELVAFRHNLMNLAKLGGWIYDAEPSYPSWKPELEGSFLKYVKKEMESVVKKELDLLAVHGGLETGVIGGLIPGIQMVAIGPLLENPHSPDERVRIADVGTMYEIIKKILANLESYTA